MRALTSVTVRVNADSLIALRRACAFPSDAPRTPRSRLLEQHEKNGLALDMAITAYVRQTEAYRAALKGGRR